MTYRQYDARGDQYARWAIANGIAKGDVVALMMPNRPEYLAVWLGITRAGGVVALLNTNLTGAALAHCVNIVEREARHRRRVADRQLSHRRAASERHGRAFWCHGGAPRAIERIDTGSMRCRTTPIPDAELPPLTIEDKCLYVYTSGTTGLPKAANINHYRVQGIMFGFNAAMRMKPDDRIYVCLPMYHTSGGVLGPGRGADGGRERRAARELLRSMFWDDIVKQRLHRLPLYRRALPLSPEQPDASAGDEAQDPPCLRQRAPARHLGGFPAPLSHSENPRMVCGDGGKLRLPQFRRQDRRGRPHPEIDGAEVLHRDRALRHRHRAAGARPGRVLHQVPVPARSARRSRRSSTTRSGRASASRAMPIPAATEKKILRDVFEKGDRWFRTGDLMRKDELGYYYFVDRIGDTFRWKGENVATSEVSEAITVFPGIKEANVYGVRVPGAEGRAGMAALVRRGRARPRRLRPACHAAARRLCAAGVPAHPARDRNDLDLQAAQARSGESRASIRAPSRDPIYFLHPQQQTYVRLDSGALRRHLRGQGAALSEECSNRPGGCGRFWRDAGPEKWFKKERRLRPRRSAERFGALHAEAAAGKHDDWAETPEGALALVLLLDQFSRNLFRGSPKTFAQDEKAREIARRAIEAVSTKRSSPRCSSFFSYAVHAFRRAIADQERCAARRSCARRRRNAEIRAPSSSDIIRRFGRFPHRNAILGRHTTPAEQAFLDGGGFAG